MELLQTDRILLRHWLESDAPDLYQYASDPDIGHRAGWKPHTSVEESRQIIASVFDDPTTWAIVLKSVGKVVGAIGYGVSCECDLPAQPDEPTVGYWVAKPYWGLGICTEALALIINYVERRTTIASL
ncbi:MAG: GNAT family N-acetyltransferase, partial [Muribaculaceae bacterium]